MNPFDMKKMLNSGDILKVDLEGIEFASAISGSGLPADEKTTDTIFAFGDADTIGDEPGESEDEPEDNVFEDRDSYRNADQEGVYYFI